MSELKPCANCAGEATRQAPNMHRKTCIACKECGMSTGWGTVEEVTATWNRRAQPENEAIVRCGECERRVKSADLTDSVLCRYLGEHQMRKTDYCSHGVRKPERSEG